MLNRRDFLVETAAGLVVPASLLASGASASPIRQDYRRSSKNAQNSKIRSVLRREDTVIRYGGHGDNWHMSWASDDQQYVSLCDGAGFGASPELYYNSRMLTIRGGATDAKFSDIGSYPMLGAPQQGANDARYYNFGTLALDGRLYQFMSTMSRPYTYKNEIANPRLDDLVRFNGVKLIYSPDGGSTWCNQDGSTPVVWQSWNDRSRNTMVFFQEDQEAFSLITILQMGKNYELNRDGYVYIYAPNGNTDGTMNELVMFRVKKSAILDRGSYEYFGGTSLGGGAKWVKNINDRRPVHTFPRGWVNKLAHPYAWHPSVVYNAPLGLYIMTNWGMGSGAGADSLYGIDAEDLWFVKPSYLGFWTASEPWGPWNQVHEETVWLPQADARARAYQPQIAPKWISADGRSIWLVWTDFQTDTSGMKRYKEERKLRGEGPISIRDNIAAQRTYMPYYGFNAQRVDIQVV